MAQYLGTVYIFFLCLDFTILFPFHPLVNGGLVHRYILKSNFAHFYSPLPRQLGGGLKTWLLVWISLTPIQQWRDIRKLVYRSGKEEQRIHFHLWFRSGGVCLHPGQCNVSNVSMRPFSSLKWRRSRRCIVLGAGGPHWIWVTGGCAVPPSLTDVLVKVVSPEPLERA